ncbi:hypothetical protein [Velocimicrobium porci]|uniref:hypothetical protein n=1 Tax=Velocimicrobium porci TaxID=2606634 RepID=UPI0012B194CF|nr:hypothetical protein [Velocimicrobium porci]
MPRKQKQVNRILEIRTPNIETKWTEVLLKHKGAEIERRYQEALKKQQAQA